MSNRSSDSYDFSDDDPLQDTESLISDDDDYLEEEIGSEDEVVEQDLYQIYNILDCDKPSYENDWKAAEPEIDAETIGKFDSIVGPTSLFNTQLEAFQSHISDLMRDK
jgi:hypothetical protein